MVWFPFCQNHPVRSISWLLDVNAESNSAGNLVVIPSVGLCVKGRLLISYGNGGYAELKDISLIPAEGQECSKFVMEGMFAN